MNSSPSPQTNWYRTMRSTDLEQVVRIEREIFLFPWSLQNFADSLQAGYICQVIDQDNVIYGYSVMMLGPDEAHLLTIGIAASQQGQGWGERLLQHFIHLAQQQNRKTMLLDVRESNHSAAKLYRRLGFKEIARRKGYYPAMSGREDAIVMERSL